MKSRYLLPVVCLFSAYQAVAQTDSPYARFGYEGKVLRTPQERQQRMMLLVPNTDTASAVAQVGLDPANQRYYLFGKDNQVLKTDTLAGTDVARFLSVDPLTKSYPWYTPYQFAGNTPIQAIDIDGLEPLTMVDKTGKLTKPIVAVLNAAFAFSNSSLTEATWQPYYENIRTKSWAKMVGVPKEMSASVMGTTVVHDADANRTSGEWFTNIAHEQSHENDIADYGTAGFYVGYGLEAITGYRNISTEQRAYEIGDLNTNNTYGSALLNYKGGALMQILNGNQSEEQKAIQSESLGARFRRDVILQDQVDYLSSQISALQTQVAGYSNSSGPGVEPRVSALQSKISGYETRRSNVKDAQSKITSKYGN